ncbi:MAG TPA: universal stress protein, partial [Opitutus sp.]|nr:universal stress protein [Opitutus sp.]
MNLNRPFILCATDFSPRAIAAASVAAKLAFRRSEKLQLVHACDASRAATIAAAAKYLEAELQRLKRTGAEVVSLLIKGRRPSAAVLEHIQAAKPTLVVVASGIKGPVDRWAVGSFSEFIAESSPVPTLVVRNPAAFESWDWTSDRLKILLALDRYASSDIVLRWARNFQKGGPCDLVSCHVNRHMPTVEELAMPGVQPTNPPALQSQLERELHKKVRDQLGDDASEIVVRPHLGAEGPCIVDIAREVHAHLIAVGTHQRHGFSRVVQFSISRELLHEAET